MERAGPTGLIVTTTAIQLHPENETRMLGIYVTDSPEQTRSVLISLASEEQQDVDLTAWVALQEWLASGETRVTIPFAVLLATRIPPVAVRLRRDFKNVLSFIRAHALLHRKSRVRREDGSIVANLDDYAVVRDLVADLIADGAGRSVPETVRETVAAVKDLLVEAPSGVTVQNAGNKLGLDKSAASRRVKQALARGYLVNLEEKRGRPHRLAIGEPMPEAVTFLPTVDELRCCVQEGASADMAGVHESEGMAELKGHDSTTEELEVDF